jgi:exonuclease VII small subunit
MADLKNQLEDINKQIEILRKKLSKEGPFKQFEATAEGINKAVEELNNLNDELDRFNDSLDDSFNSWRSIISEAKTSNQLLNQNNNILSSSAGISQKISDHFKGINTLSEKEAKNLQKSLDTQQSKLKSQTDMLGKKLSELQYEKEGLGNGDVDLKRKAKINSEMAKLNRTIQNNNTLLKGGDKLYKQESSKLQEIQKHHKEINKELGFAPQLAAGLDNILKKMGLPDLGVADALTEAKELGLEAKAQGKSFDTMAHFTGKLKDNFMGAFTKANLLQGAVLALVNAFGTSQKGIGDLAKGLGMSASRATVMRQEFADISNSSMNANLSVKALQESQLAIGQALGTNAKLNTEDLETMTDLVKKTGLQHSELIGIEKLSLATGKSLDDNVEAALGGATAFASQNKLVVDNNKVLREVNKASSALKLSLGGSVEELGKAVVQAQKFGINLEQAENIASSMLDFESSIEAELSAELLTGKNLNLEKARGLALEGKSVEAAAEILKQVGGTAEFSKMNVIQQEAMAKAVGMTRDQLASSLIEREALEKMSAKEGESALQAYERLKAQGKTQAEIVALLGEKAAGDLEQQSAQEKFNNSVEHLKDIFVQVMDELAPVFDVLASIAEIVLPAINYALLPVKIVFEAIGSSVQMIKDMFAGDIEPSFENILGTALKLGGAIVAIVSTMKIYKAIQAGIALQKRAALIAEAQGNSLGKGGAIMALIRGAWSSSGVIPFIGAGLAIAAIAGGMALINSQAKAEKVQDAAIDPKGGLIVSGPKGTYQGDPNDTVIMGTGIGKGKGKTTPQQGGGGGTVNIDMTQTNALLQQLINVIQTGGNVMLDGQKVGTALKLGSFKTQ